MANDLRLRATLDLGSETATDWRADILPAQLPSQAGRPVPCWRQHLQRLATWCSSNIDVDDILVAVGLALLARGCWLVTPAAGWIVPGAILLWWALPQRPRFLAPKPPSIIRQIGHVAEGRVDGRNVS